MNLRYLARSGINAITCDIWDNGYPKEQEMYYVYFIYWHDEYNIRVLGQNPEAGPFATVDLAQKWIDTMPLYPNTALCITVLQPK